MYITNIFKVTISPLTLHSVSSVHILYSTNRFKSFFPSVMVTPLTYHSASSINLHGASNNNIFHNRLRIRLSPMKSPILRKYKNPYKRSGMYPSISKCNAKCCIFCKYLNCKSTIVSNVNNRQFSVVNDSDLDWNSKDVIYSLTCSEKAEGCSMLDKPNGLSKLGLVNNFGKWKPLRKLILTYPVRNFWNLDVIICFQDYLHCQFLLYIN